MSVQKAILSIRMQEWARQIQECQQSGMTIREWCEENGISTKVYYYRRKRAREELLDAAGSGQALQVSSKALSLPDAPVFASFSMPKGSKGAAATVRLGDHSVDIYNSADGEVIEYVLKVVSRL